MGGMVGMGERGDAGACTPSPVAAESTAYGPDARALVWSGWKLIERDGTGPALYDLGKDPGERHDLAGCRPRTLAALSGLLAHELAPRGGGRGEAVAPLAPLAPLAPDPETVRQLRSLGYAGGGG